MVNSPDSAPLSELVSGLVADVTGLLRKEIDLAKTEISEKASKALVGIEALLVGMVLAIGAIGVLLSALVNGLAALFIKWGMMETSASSLAAVIVGMIIAAIAWTMMSKGLTALRAGNLKLDRTTTSLRRDVDAVKEKI
ncbi:MAG: phage holin family protein [Cytophagaceae bacterium]|nr:MAG: phage holin family protein [Cytophagaceae bacterium]